MQSSIQYTTDVLIIGSGASGLSLALRLGKIYNVIILTKDLVHESSTTYAQGGVAAVFDVTDSVDSHISDTLIAGAGICDFKSVEFIISNARHCLEWLINQGVVFDSKKLMNGGFCYKLAQEGGHSCRRILHSSDATGDTIERALVVRVKAHSRIRVIECCRAVEIITSFHLGLSGVRRVVGVYFWNLEKKEVELCRAKVVVLATGGASRVYQYSTNPAIASGDGIAMAWRAGCRVANLEFNQFHPTCLFHPKARNFLLTEALRGEGAYLCRQDGSRFMEDFDMRADLAPRDIVSRAINHEMKRLNVDCMYLNISHRSETFIRQNFPTIYDYLIKLDIDLTKQPIPIVPAAHYTCGGVVVDQKGRTDLEGLYAVGEVSYTGLHGANRLASNSLLECVVCAWSAAQDIQYRLPDIIHVSKLPSWNKNNSLTTYDVMQLQYKLHNLRVLMWENVGIIRSSKQLKFALNYINLIKTEINEYYSNYSISNDFLEVRNLVQVAELVVKSALRRKESRGLHFIVDYPEKQLEPHATILCP
ncbi:L-aspartate oxidase [secondary endosymbiont of Heteropsylla cubana]|uniref:L-aspartate oxidase n=1 Tax=secondary endosymbiont of Heteropsylla cubana TaxID=134287 RepID=J3TYN1_9ENTR|nr:L-aspartate oxidase [secondary endosymbiont of Heteropsylla cubana]AFP85515.1 L-aspartate oxidase [secondary endosymbiont of Heteropsylla cubana]